jgi:hypothetical protein
MGAIVGASITYRLAFGPNAGRKALTRQTVPLRTEQRKGDHLVSQQAGFSLHAGISPGPPSRSAICPWPTTATSSSTSRRRTMMELPGRAVRCSPESHGIHGALGGTGAQTASEFVGDAWSRFHGVFSANSKLREYVGPLSVGPRSVGPRSVGPRSAGV